jgi:hypothetical protein
METSPLRTLTRLTASDLSWSFDLLDLTFSTSALTAQFLRPIFFREV